MYVERRTGNIDDSDNEITAESYNGWIVAEGYDS